MSRENFCLRLNSLEKEPVYVMVAAIEYFTLVQPEVKGGRAHGTVRLNSGEDLAVHETPQEILQLARTTGILTPIPN